MKETRSFLTWASSVGPIKVISKRTLEQKIFLVIFDIGKIMSSAVIFGFFEVGKESTGRVKIEIFRNVSRIFDRLEPSVLLLLLHHTLSFTQ